MGISTNIRHFREAMDLTQEELALKLGISQVFISKIENGIKIPSLPLTKEIAKVLEVSVDEIVK